MTNLEKFMPEKIFARAATYQPKSDVNFIYVLTHQYAYASKGGTIEGLAAPEVRNCSAVAVMTADDQHCFGGILHMGAAPPLFCGEQDTFDEVVNEKWEHFMSVLKGMAGSDRKYKALLAGGYPAVKGYPIEYEDIDIYLKSSGEGYDRAFENLMTYASSSEISSILSTRVKTDPDIINIEDVALEGEGQHVILDVNQGRIEVSRELRPANPREDFLQTRVAAKRIKSYAIPMRPR